MAPKLLEQRRRDPLRLIQQRQKEVLIVELRVASIRSHRLRGLERFLHALCKTVNSHNGRFGHPLARSLPTSLQKPHPAAAPSCLQNMRHRSSASCQLDTSPANDLAILAGPAAIARVMKAPLRVLAALVVAIFVAGCFQSEVIVSVKPDGSGTVTETMLMSKAMVDQMKQMAEGFTKGFEDAAKELDPNAKTTKSEKPSASKGFDLLDEKKL